MTRGTVILKNGKVFIALGYSNSDSYPSGEIGQMLVKALSNSSDEETVQIIRELIGGLQKDEFSKDCMESLREIGEAFYNKKAATKVGLDDVYGYYYDYSYVYDIKTRKLQIFHFGQLEYSFKKEDFPFLRLVVENDELLYTLSYDTKNKCFKGIDAEVKKVKRMKKAGKSPQYILEIAKSLSERIHYVVDEVYSSDCWPNAVQKGVTFYPSRKRLKFIFKENYGKWNVYIQLPWVRQGLIHNCTSRKAAMNKLIAYLDGNWESFQSGMDLYELYEDCQQKLMNFYNACDQISITKDEFNESVGQIEKEFRGKLIPLEELDYSGWTKAFGPDRAKKEIANWIFMTHRHIFDCIQKA
ncbi:hypothetical protein ACTNDZ_14050 [Selenomonas montiformis]|uniref:hypothetical protein n=1 Tax=Selenomonas montiformis TaxID=2652285 RepID=UPI003F8C0DD4